MYIYHYYATKQTRTNVIVNIDGLIKRDHPFSGDWEEYQSLKRDINDGVSEEITICSLTLLGN